ncbi:MAG TPA: hypothetical protein VGQ81_10280 [Acidobacteriota bacterium]|nr:hypothetical protein [Acidobacteriota bacterium]
MTRFRHKTVYVHDHVHVHEHDNENVVVDVDVGVPSVHRGSVFLYGTILSEVIVGADVIVALVGLEHVELEKR